MASPEQARTAVTELASRLAELDHQTRARIPDRTVSVLLHDLGSAYTCALQDGLLVAITQVDAAATPDTQLRLVMTSDQLVELVDGRLSFAGAWATGKIRVHARLRDVLELRKFL
jgi:hypothetical protein